MLEFWILLTGPHGARGCRETQSFVTFFQGETKEEIEWKATNWADPTKQCYG